MQNYVVNEQVVAGLINYLSSRPYGEVFKFVEILTTLQPQLEGVPCKCQEEAKVKLKDGVKEARETKKS